METVAKPFRVLVVPLNWGLGHTTRLIPIIRELKKLNVEIIAGGSPVSLLLLKQEFGELPTVRLPFLHIKLGKHRSQIGIIALQLPLILFYISREHAALRKIVRKHRIDMVISDNCFGLWNRKVYSVIITHQLNIRLPRMVSFLNRFITNINSWFIRHYDECWVPDYEEQMGFAGKLSHAANPGISPVYLGILSRFLGYNYIRESSETSNKKKILILISGPEKQRSVFEKIIYRQIHRLHVDYTYTIVRGLPKDDQDVPSGWYNHLPSDQLANMILAADYIICRSGYSSIMDLIALNRTALLVPTPGQPEQTYLADYLCSRDYFLSMKQHEFNLVDAIKLLNEKKNKYIFQTSIMPDQLSQNLSKTIFAVIKAKARAGQQ